MELSPFFELTLDLVFVAGKDGFFKKVNKAAMEKFGFSKEELFSRPISEFIHPDDRNLTTQEREKLLTGEPLVNFQNRYITKTGKEIWLEWTSIYMPDEELVFAIAKDVTVRKMAELEVEAKYKKAQSLANHFKSNIERDRKYLSVNLHEELAQLLAVLKIDIDWMRVRQQGLPDEILKRLEHAGAISELLMKTIQRISFSISPGMLNDLGLQETLKWHCNELTMISSITCSVEGACDESKLTKETQLDLFRICQEALHNVIYHSEATDASIRIIEDEKEIVISITDNGKGFVLTQHIESSGLKIMQERAASINALFAIETNIGKGTEVKITFAK